MQQIQRKIIQLPVLDSQTFSFYGLKQKGFAPIYMDMLFESLPEARVAEHKNYYSDFQPARPDNIKKCEEVIRVISYVFKSISNMYRIQAITFLRHCIIGSDIIALDDVINKTTSNKQLGLDI